MAIPTTSGLPAVIEAGNNYNFQETFTDFPASAWSMQFVMSLDGSNVAPNVTNATSYGNTFNIAIGVPTTPGRYLFAEYVTETSSSQRATGKTGVIQVIKNLSTLIGMRTRLQAEVIRERQTEDAFRGIETSGRIGTRFKS